MERYDWPRWRWVTLAKHFYGQLASLEGALAEPFAGETTNRPAGENTTRQTSKALAVQWLRAGRIFAPDVAAALNSSPSGRSLSTAEATEFAERFNRSAIAFEAQARASFERTNEALSDI